MCVIFTMIPFLGVFLVFLTLFILTISFIPFLFFSFSVRSFTLKKPATQAPYKREVLCNFFNTIVACKNKKKKFLQAELRMKKKKHHEEKCVRICQIKNSKLIIQELIKKVHIQKCA